MAPSGKKSDKIYNMADLLINGRDALATYGVRMGAKFLDALGAPAPMKEYITDDSRLEHGRNVITDDARVDYRDLNLEFTIQGMSPADYQVKKKAFFAELYKGAVSICVPPDSADVYHLVYRGNSPTYARSRDRCFGKVIVKFEEPNPTIRT